MILHQIDKVFVIPVVQCSFGDLEMRRCNTASKLCEKRAHYFRELFVLNNVQDFLKLVEEHNFFWRVRLWPEFEQPVDHWGGKRRIFFQKLDDAISKLRMINRERLELVKWNQNFKQENLVFFFERQREPIDDRSKDFKELGDAVVPLGFVHEAVENIVDLSSDIRAEVEELAINSMQRGFEKISLSWIFRIKKLKQLDDESLVDVFLCDCWFEIGRFEKTTNRWSMYFFAIVGLKSGDSRKRRKNS